MADIENPVKNSLSSPSLVAYARLPMYKRRPSAALAMTASFSAALMGCPPVTLLSPVGATGAILVLAKASVTLSTADIIVVKI